MYAYMDKISDSINRKLILLRSTSLDILGEVIFNTMLTNNWLYVRGGAFFVVGYKIAKQKLVHCFTRYFIEKLANHFYWIGL